MSNRIVVSVRLPFAGIALDGTSPPLPEGVAARVEAPYLDRARAIVARAEALGATLAAWSAVTFAFSWDPDSIEEAVSLATGLAGDAPSPDRAWACGIAEGVMEALAPRGERAELAWGPALVLAVSLARVARPGEVLVDGDVRAMRVGELATAGTRAATDSGRRVRGWILNLAGPFRRTSSMRNPRVNVQRPSDPDSTAQLIVPQIRDRDPTIDTTERELAATDENVVPLYDADILELVEAAESPPPKAVVAPPAAVSLPKWNDVTERTILPPVEAPPPEKDLAHQIRKMAHVNGSGDPSRAGPDALLALRAARARVEGGSAKARCQASLALAVALALAQRPEDALLEGLDALARAREAGDTRAEGASLAFLAKLYAGVSRFEHAVRLREVAGPRP